VIAQGLWFADAKDLSKIPMGSPQTGASNRGGGRYRSAIFHQYLAVSETVPDRNIVTMEGY